MYVWCLDELANIWSVDGRIWVEGVVYSDPSRFTLERARRGAEENREPTMRTTMKISTPPRRTRQYHFYSQCPDDKLPALLRR